MAVPRYAECVVGTDKNLLGQTYRERETKYNPSEQLFTYLPGQNPRGGPRQGEASCGAMSSGARARWIYRRCLVCL